MNFRKRTSLLAFSLGCAMSVAFACPVPSPARTTDAAVSAPSPAGPERNAARLIHLFATDADREDRLDPLAPLYGGDTSDPARFARSFTDALDRDEAASASRSLKALHAIDRAALSPELRLSYDTFAMLKEEELTWQDPKLRALTRVRPFSHFGGIHLEFASMMGPGGTFEYATGEDYARALAIYRTFPQVIDNAIVRFREGTATGVVEPRLTVTNMIAQIDGLTAQPLDSSPFYAPVRAFPTAVPASSRNTLRKEYRTTIEGTLIPAYERLRQFLATEYLPAARESVGLGQMKGGAELYRALIRRETTLPLEPAEIHRLGLAEVARIRGDMEKVRVQLGFAGTLPAFFDEIRDDPRFHPTTSKQLSDGFARIGKQVAAALPAWFERVPATALVIEPYPFYRAKFEAGGSYAEGSPDRGRPAIFYYNTYDLPHRFLSGMTTLYMHEGVPGHHLQISLAQENADLPSFQRFGGNSAFVEGWALYAETLGYDMGFYKDPLQHWGTLDDEMLRAMRLVVDTGIHAQGWSRQQAIDYMLANSGIGRSDAEAEVDRYIAMPAQALSYKIGALTIQRLRRKAEAALGTRFDIREFHEQVLGSGALPLPILEAKIDRWIEDTRAGPIAPRTVPVR
jgi:uncharacterized protein (DUF885 family)